MEENFHLNSQAAWLLALLGVILLVGGYVWRNWLPDSQDVRRRRTGVAVIAMLLGVGMLPGSYLLFRHIDSQADARDIRVQTILADSPVKFKGFEGVDTETVRVEALVAKETGKPCKKGQRGCVPCQASFSVIGQSGNEWPLKRDSGSGPSKGCDLGDADEDGRYSEGSEKFYLNQIFVDPYRHRK